MDHSKMENHTITPYFDKIEGWVILGTAYAFISLLGMIGNSFVLIAVASSESLRTIPNVFIVNLAVADLLYCLALPLHVVSVMGQYHQSFDKMCFAFLFIAHSSAGCSVCTLASIALNRLVLIVSPNKYYGLIFRKKVLVLWIVLMWIYTLSIAGIPPVALGIGKLTFDPTLHYCRTPKTLESSRYYDTVLIYGYFPFQMVIIFVCYFGVLVRVYLHNQTMMRYRAQHTNSIGGSLNQLDEAPIPSAGDAYKLQMSITKNMVVIFCAFIVCYAPHIICNQIYEECPIDGFGRLMVSLNSAVNPIIYGFNHPQFRRVFIKLLHVNIN